MADARTGAKSARTRKRRTAARVLHRAYELAQRRHGEWMRSPCECGAGTVLDCFTTTCDKVRERAETRRRTAAMERHMTDANTPFEAEVLHLYGQTMWHDDAIISGSREVLVKLRAAIDAALVDGTSELTAFAADGEGYTLSVVAMSGADALRQSVPYTYEHAADQRPYEERFGPWVVLREKNGGGA